MKLAQILANIEKYSPLVYTLRSDSILLFRGRICIPDDESLKQEILKEAHKSHYTIHPGVAKNIPRPKASVLVEWYEKRYS